MRAESGLAGTQNAATESPNQCNLWKSASDWNRVLPLAQRLFKGMQAVSSPGIRRADFEVFPSGIAIPTSKARLERGFQEAGFVSYLNRRTAEVGCNYVDPQNGNIYRVMAGSAQHRPRLITHSPRPGNPPRLPDGTAIPGTVLGQHAVRDLTHFYLESS